MLDTTGPCCRRRATRPADHHHGRKRSAQRRHHVRRWRATAVCASSRAILAKRCWRKRRPATSSCRRHASYTGLGSDLFRTRGPLRAPIEGERFYGLGQHKHGFLDQKGCVITLDQRNTEVTHPLPALQPRLWLPVEQPGRGPRRAGANGTHWVADSQPPDGLLDHRRRHVRRDPGALHAKRRAARRMLPSWAAGFWQCKLRYRTQDELLSVAREYKRRGLPLSVIVIDFLHWPQFGDWTFDPVCLARPGRHGQRAGADGHQAMVSVWPSLHRESVNYDTMAQQGLLIRSERGLPFHVPFIDPASGRAHPLAELRCHQPRGAGVPVGQAAARTTWPRASRCGGSMPVSRRWRPSTTTTCATTSAMAPRSAVSIRCCTSRVSTRA